MLTHFGPRAFFLSEWSRPSRSALARNAGGDHAPCLALPLQSSRGVVLFRAGFLQLSFNDVRNSRARSHPAAAAPGSARRGATRLRAPPQSQANLTVLRWGVSAIRHLFQKYLEPNLGGIPYLRRGTIPEHRAVNQRRVATGERPASHRGSDSPGRRRSRSRTSPSPCNRHPGSSPHARLSSLHRWGARPREPGPR